jgi:hypothetical protein
MYEIESIFFNHAVYNIFNKRKIKEIKVVQIFNILIENLT